MVSSQKNTVWNFESAWSFRSGWVAWDQNHFSLSLQDTFGTKAVAAGHVWSLEYDVPLRLRGSKSRQSHAAGTASNLPVMFRNMWILWSNARVLPEFAWLTNPKHYWRTRSSELQGTTLKLGKRPKMKSWSFENPSNSQWGGVFERCSNMMRDPKNQLHPWSFWGGTPISRGVFFSV